jgi:hypothetical protein
MLVLEVLTPGAVKDCLLTVLPWMDNGPQQTKGRTKENSGRQKATVKFY